MTLDIIKMLRMLIMRVGFKEIVKRPSLWSLTITSFLIQSHPKAVQVYNKVVESHRSEFRQKKPSQMDKIIDFLCALHLQEESVLQSQNFEEFSWLYTTKANKIYVTRAWIDAIQQELGISLIPQELLTVPYIKRNNFIIFETIHYIHKATYNILKHKNIVPDYSHIFRNAIKPQQSLELKGTLSQNPLIEFDQVKVAGILNTRCCSIKPHGCENYDFDLSLNRRFVIARGMEEKGLNSFECVMPTILYTFHYKNPNRFKASDDLNKLITISGKQLEDFFYLYEVHNV